MSREPRAGSEPVGAGHSSSGLVRPLDPGSERHVSAALVAHVADKAGVVSREQEIRKRAKMCAEQVADMPYSHPVACGWYAADVSWLLAELERERAARKKAEEQHRRVVANESNHYDRYWQPIPSALTAEWLDATEAKMREALEDVFCDDAAAVMLTLITHVRKHEIALARARAVEADQRKAVDHGADDGVRVVNHNRAVLTGMSAILAILEAAGGETG